MNKTFKASDWKKLAIFSAPTATAAQVRIDSDGVKWVWVTAGKRVTARKVP